MMKSWLRTTLARLLIAGLITVVLAWLFLLWPVSRAKTVIKHQLVASGQSVSAIGSAKTLIASLPEIDKVQVRQLGSFNNYASTVEQIVKKLNKLSISYNKPNKIIGLNISDKTQVVADTNMATGKISQDDIQITKTDIKHLQDFFSYHAEISKTLVNILEYDPAADTSGFSLGSDDTNQRLLLAQKGLAKTLDQLVSTKKKYNDSTLNQTISTIKSLQDSRDHLAKTGDISAWIDAVDQTQSNIISNRKKFLDSNTNSFQAELNTDSTNFSKIKKAWTRLVKQYKL